MSGNRRSRPAREAARLAELDDGAALKRFDSLKVDVVILPEAVDSPDARMTFLFAVNQCLRFAGAVGVATEDVVLASDAAALAEAIAGEPLSDAAPDITLVVGNTIVHDRPSVTVNSNGWLARVATSAGDRTHLATATSAPNRRGAPAAACLGVSQVFHFFAGLPLASEAELSLYSFRSGAVGTLSPDAVGPPLPARIELDALFVGCGGVVHGFAYALRELPVYGRARAVDHQRLGEQNIGPYVLATLAGRGEKKAEIIRNLLAPNIVVTPYDESYYPLFTTRLDRGHFSLPPTVVAGLDRVAPRHRIQSIQPELLIDMGAGGETAQLIVKRRGDEGACVVELLDRPRDEADDLDQLATESGLAAELIRDAMDAPLTENDVANAPEALRADMEAARRRGELRCGFVRSRALDHEAEDDEFAAAVPFVVSLAGIAAAATLVRAELEPTASSRFQFSFLSLRAAPEAPQACRNCDCQRG
jgi:hypothetical protein